MAKIERSKKYESALYDLDENDLKILDLSMRCLKDDLTKYKIDLTDYEKCVLNNLHDLILKLQINKLQDSEEPY